MTCPERALLSVDRRSRLSPGETFRLDWSRMDFTPDRVYLQQWDMLARLPQFRHDFPMRLLWPGLRKTWEYAFIGPADTLSGLHCDFPNNWFCQVRGANQHRDIRSHPQRNRDRRRHRVGQGHAASGASLPLGQLHMPPGAPVAEEGVTPGETASACGAGMWVWAPGRLHTSAHPGCQPTHTVAQPAQVQRP